MDQPPATPPEMRRYRKSRLGQPGVRVQHWGTANDERSGEFRYGIQTVGKESNNVLGAEQMTRIGDYMKQRKEAIYESSKVEPLGKPFIRGTLPKDATPETSYGKPSVNSESCLGLLFPKDNPYTSGQLDSDPQVKTMYVKSHGTYEPGEQRTRDYNWKGVDPNSHRFGAKDKEGYHEGVKKALNPGAEHKTGIEPTELVPKRVEEFRKLHNDELGRPRNLGLGKPSLPAGHSYGMPSSKGEDWGARECVQGDYSLDQQAPDKDLGRSVLKGACPPQLVTSTSTRIFGVPSVREDIRAPAKKSVADSQNYGDEPSAKELLYPAPYATRGVNESDFMRALPKDELEDIMFSSGALNDHQLFDDVWNAATRGNVPALSIDDFRRKMMELVMR